MRYIIEQTLSDFENNLNRIKKLIERFKGLNEEVKIKMGEDPNGFGQQFFTKGEELLDLISKVDSYSEDTLRYITDNKNEVTKTLKEFKDIFETHYPEIYDQAFKSEFDPLLNDPLFKEGMPKIAFGVSDTSTGAKNEAPKETEKSKYATDYTGVSIVDFLNKSGQPSDKASRAKLAVDLGIVSKPEDYKFTAAQNTQMLNMLRSGKGATNSTEAPKTTGTPKIKFGGTDQIAYVEAGKGAYVPATEDQLADPNVQLYVKNPKKGQGEYLKPNYIKVRREGSTLRPQSQFGGVAGSISNLFGDIGNTLAGKQ